MKREPEIIIREAEAADAGALILYLNKVAGESENLGFGAGEFEKSEEDEARFLEDNQEASNCHFLLALIGDEIVGELGYTGGHRLRTRHTGEMGVTVLKEFWGQGIGSLLIDTLLAWAQGTRIVTKVDLLVRADNERAIQLYERKGFEREGRIRRSICIDGTYHDALAMGLLVLQNTFAFCEV